QEGREEGGDHQKFPAYYRWCRGATKRQLRRLRGIGFEVERYVTVFGHGYFWKAPRLAHLADRTTAWLCRRRLALFGAYAMVTLRRPPAPADGVAGAQKRAEEGFHRRPPGPAALLSVLVRGPR